MGAEFVVGIGEINLQVEKDKLSNSKLMEASTTENNSSAAATEEKSLVLTVLGVAGAYAILEGLMLWRRFADIKVENAYIRCMYLTDWTWTLTGISLICDAAFLAFGLKTAMGEATTPRKNLLAHRYPAILTAPFKKKGFCFYSISALGRIQKVALASTIAITIFFWCILLPMGIRRALFFEDFVKHGATLVLLLVPMSYARQKIMLSDCIGTYLWFGLYFNFIILTWYFNWKTTNRSRGITYSVFNFYKHPIRAWIFWGFAVLVLPLLAHIAAATLLRLSVRLVNACKACSANDATLA